MAEVVAVRKDNQDRIVAFKLDDGRELDYEQCVDAIHNGELPSLICTNTQTGSLSIRTQADGNPDNNLSRLPLF